MRPYYPGERAEVRTRAIKGGSLVEQRETAGQATFEFPARLEG